MIPFEVTSPNIDESHRNGETPQEYVERLSIEKAQAVINADTKALVIGSDQIALHGNKIIGKPRDHQDAIDQLLSASGKIVTLYTGLALINSITGDIQSDVIPFKVHFKQLDQEIAENYLLKEKPYGCAGSLKADGLGIALLERFEGGDPNALIGLPLIRLIDMLSNEGVSLI